MWGQGLRTFDKISFLTRDAIAREVDVAGANPPYVLAHSGAQIKPRGEEPDTNDRKPGEVPSSVPSITRQVDLAKDLLSWDGIAHQDDVDLVLMDGGINDVGVDRILDRDSEEQQIRDWTLELATNDMGELLRTVLGTFTRAKVIITAYHQIVTRFTPLDEFEKLLLRFDIPFPIPPFEAWRDEIADQCWVFADAALQGLNSLWSELSQEEQNRVRIGRVSWPPSAGYGVPGSGGVFRVIRAQQLQGGPNEPLPVRFFSANDPLYNERRAICSTVPGATYRCRLAGAGHPNEEGVKRGWLGEIGGALFFSGWLYEWGKPRPPEVPTLVCWPEPESPPTGTSQQIMIGAVDDKTHAPVIDATATISNPTRIAAGGQVIWETHTGIPTNRPVQFTFRRLRDVANREWIWPTGSVRAPGYPNSCEIPFAWPIEATGMAEDAPTTSAVEMMG
jgi:hypothetical protein